MVISYRHPVELILKSLNDNVFESLKSIKIHSEQEKVNQKGIWRSTLIPEKSPLHFLHSATNNDLEIVIEVGLNLDAFVSELNICAARKRSVSLDLAGGEISRLLLRERLPSLHALIFNAVKENSLETIAGANAKGKLPNLCVLDISSTSVGGRLHMLLTEMFPSLTTLVLSECKLETEDYASLAVASVGGKLPELRHIDISQGNILRQNRKLELNKSFCSAFPKLTTLIARSCLFGVGDLRCLSEANGAGKLHRLTSLDLSDNIFISGRVSVLLCLRLNILILRGCFLNSNGMCSIELASAENRLPQLKLLDLSINEIGCRSQLHGLWHLLSGRFPSLTHLILCDCELNEQDLDILAQAKLDGKLPALKYIDVSFNNLTGYLDHLTRDHRTGCEVSWDRIVCFEEFLYGSRIS